MARRALKENPGSRHYKENRSYQKHRGYYWKDQQGSGKWRTPDGRIARGQKRDPTTGRWDLPRAKRYNANRHAELTARDAVNAARSRGVDLTLKDAKQTYGEARDRDEDAKRVLLESLFEAAEDQDVDFDVEIETEDWGY